MHVPLGATGAYADSDPPACTYLPSPCMYDFALVDGPPNIKGGDARDGALEILRKLVKPDAIIVIDDTHRKGDSALAARIAESRGLERATYSEGLRKFDVLWPKRNN